MSFIVAASVLLAALLAGIVLDEFGDSAWHRREREHSVLDRW